MALTMEQLHEMVFEVSGEVFTPENVHLKDLWRAFLGGFVLPKMAELDPASVDGNEEFKKLISEFSKEKIKEMFTKEKVIEEKIVEKERIIVKEKPIIIQTGEKVIHRRLKSNVNKIKRKVRGLNCEERDLVIDVFNDTQDMISKESEVFKILTDTINEKRKPEDKISASQCAGYWSFLCRQADVPKAKRDEWIEKSLKKGTFSFVPKYSDAFVEKIRANYAARRKEAEERQKDHNHIKATGERRKVLAPAPQPKPVDAIDFTDFS